MPPKTIGNLTKVFCFSGLNLVILAWTGDELSSGQASDWYTHTHTQTQATTIPGGQNWPRVKMIPVFNEPMNKAEWFSWKDIKHRYIYWEIILCASTDINRAIYYVIYFHDTNAIWKSSSYYDVIMIHVVICQANDAYSCELVYRC